MGPQEGDGRPPVLRRARKLLLPVCHAFADHVRQLPPMPKRLQELIHTWQNYFWPSFAETRSKSEPFIISSSVLCSYTGHLLFNIPRITFLVIFPHFRVHSQSVVVTKITIWLLINGSRIVCSRIIDRLFVEGKWGGEKMKFAFLQQQQHTFILEPILCTIEIYNETNCRVRFQRRIRFSNFERHSLHRPMIMPAIVGLDPELWHWHSYEYDQ
jgi:hypothetical protein